MYDPVIGRWLSADPYGQYASPYVGMGNDPVSGVDPDGGYSYLGAKWRQAAASLWGNDPGKVYKSGSEWGFNTSSGSSFTGHFGPQRANPETENLINQIDVHYQRGQYNPRTGYIEGSGAVEANYIEFDAALAYFTWGAGNEFKAAFEEGTTAFRYMTDAELQAIRYGEGSGFLRGGNPGKTYFTKDLYKSGVYAQQRLSLPTTPTLRVEFEILNNPTMRLNGSKVLPDFGMTGKGAEFMTTDPVRVRLINWQPLR